MKETLFQNCYRWNILGIKITFKRLVGEKKKKKIFYTLLRLSKWERSEIKVIL